MTTVEMRAVVFEGPGQDPQVRTVTLQQPRRGEVMVRIAASGVCHSDLHTVKGEWGGALPVVLGHEGSGTVVAVGDGVDDLEPGDHVVLSWVAPCGECRWCLAGAEARCERAANLVGPGGVMPDGTTRLILEGRVVHHYLGASTMAEYAVVPASGAVRIRPDAPLDLVSLVGCAVVTGIGAVRNTADVQPGSSVVVIGCGGVGLNLVQGARLAGAGRIVAVDLRPEKTSLARTLGATDEVVVAPGEDMGDAVRALLPDGADYVFDAIGRTETTEQAITLLGIGGAAIIVGLPPEGTSARFDPLTLAYLDQRVLGCNYGGARPARDIPAIIDLVMSGEVLLEPLVSSRRPLEDAAAALHDLGTGAVLRTLLIPGAPAGSDQQL